MVLTDRVDTEMETDDQQHHSDPPKGVKAKRNRYNINSSSQEDMSGISQTNAQKAKIKKHKRTHDESEALPIPGCSTHDNYRQHAREKQEITIVITVKKEQATAFFSDTVGVFRKIEKSIIGKAGIKMAVRNEQRQTMTITVGDQSKVNEILQLKNLEEYEINCSIPLAQQQLEHRYGVIGPIGIDTKTEEIEKMMQDEGYDVKVERLKRKSGNTWEPTKQVKICFPVKVLPEYITLMYERFEVRQFVTRPWQCYNCQGYGHSAKWCKRKQRCLLCAQEHKYNECPQWQNGQYECANCGNDHPANSNMCVKMKDEKEIQQMRCNKHITYSEAVKEIKGKIGVVTSTERQSTGFIQKHREANTREEQCRQKVANIRETREAMTQTGGTGGGMEVGNEISAACSFGNLDGVQAAFLLEVINGVTTANTMQKKCAIFAEAYSSYYQSNIDVEKIQECISRKQSKKVNEIGKTNNIYNGRTTRKK